MKTILTRGGRCGLVVCALLLPASAPAQGPDKAVSRANATLAFSAAGAGANNSSAGAFGGGGSLFAPLGPSIGLGIGAVGGVSTSNSDVEPAVDGNVAFFWRKPDKGVAGIGGSGFYLGDVSGGDGFVFASPYWEDWDLTVSAGVGAVDGDATVDFGLGFGVFPNERVRLAFGGAIGTSDAYSGTGAFEIQIPSVSSMVSLSLSGGGGSIDGVGFYSGALALRFSWVGGASLKSQHREFRL